MNPYSKKYSCCLSKQIPSYLIDPKNLNEFNHKLYDSKRFLEFMKKIVKNAALPYLPNELWFIILEFKNIYEKKYYNDWIFSDENIKSSTGMTLRNRTLYNTNIVGIFMNDCRRITTRNEIGLKITKETTKELEAFSYLYFKLIIRWYHYLYNLSLIKKSYIKLLETIDTKTSYFVEKFGDFGNKYINKNFDNAYYFINIYYKNYLNNSLTKEDIKFEKEIFFK